VRFSLLALILAIAATVLLTATSSARLTQQEEQSLVNSFRYRYDTRIEARYVGTQHEPDSCANDPNVGYCTCWADYKVEKIHRVSRGDLRAMKAGQILRLPYRCTPNSVRPISLFSPYEWGQLLNNNMVLFTAPHYLYENVNQELWMFGRNRGFVPVLPRYARY
jgi:hypothetical protein